ncbi:MAG: cupredoxin domain-containing protein [Chloroflexota bacterium]
MAKKKKRSQSPNPIPPAASDASLSPEERATRRAQQKQEWAAQKQAEDRAASSSFAPIMWAGGVIGTLVIVAIVGIVLFSGGGSSSTTPTPGPTADPRLGGALPVATFAVSADDAGVNIATVFSPSQITAKAGEVFEIDVTNDGSSAHNLNIAGLDGEYQTADDWTTTPSSLPVGAKGKVVVKLDVAGTYKFHCDFHPDTQLGTLIITGSAGSASPSATAAASPTPSP